MYHLSYIQVEKCIQAEKMNLLVVLSLCELHRVQYVNQDGYSVMRLYKLL